MARWIIAAGGLFTIVSVIGILVLIARVAFPLFLPPSIDLEADFAPPPQDRNAGVLAVGVGDYLENGFTLSDDGRLTFFNPKSGAPSHYVTLPHPAGALQGADVGVAAVEPFRRGEYTLLWRDGAVSLIRVRTVPRFDPGQARRIEAVVETLAAAPALDTATPPTRAMARHVEDAGDTLVYLLAEGSLRIVRRARSENLLGEVTLAESTAEIAAADLPGPVSALALDAAGQRLYAGTLSGHLLRWDLTDLEAITPLDNRLAFSDERAITVLALGSGDATLVVGDARGGVSGWFPVPLPGAAEGAATGGAARKLALVHPLKPHESAITGLIASSRSKMVVSLDEGGTLNLDYLTTERHLGSTAGSTAGAAGARLVGLAQRDNGLLVQDDQGRIALWKLDIPHPEVSWGGYFGEIRYEGYPQPDYVWQSSAATEEYEPKFSLIPLVFGTLKGTLYGMAFAAPLGILAALYTSHLMHARLRRYIKPAFEIMASVPTVVIGFLAALWLAPLVNASLTGFLLILGVLPLTVLGGLVLWEIALHGLGWQQRVRGYEFLLLIPLLLVGVWGAFALGSWLDSVLFAGSLPHWLFDQLGVRFDQRNSIIISCALGFAVLPIIFTISDDALNNVPRHLTAASLALGASVWQTVWRVVLPSASPGIFAALMVGFGRAIGETMIVLMATGNTPIMNWSAFNGMRTLSANIAVEIPEAPVDGTLYRTLFLSAVLLFIATFTLNSAAEVVRQRLRKRFGM